VRYLVFTFCLLFVALAAVAQPPEKQEIDESTIKPEDRVENWTGKTVLVYTPHPDDDTFACGGIMNILAKNDNKVIVIIYTNDNKGSKDPEMTRERLARIRRAEEEKACEILGIPKENIIWLGYEDGDLEYADPRVLRGKACYYMKKYRPDAVFTIDPGLPHVNWHKTDHRMAANITKDAFIASEWHLYYPQHLLDEGLEGYSVPVAYYYYSDDPNYTVDITEVYEAKLEASLAHVSQFPPSVDKYSPELPDSTKGMVKLWADANARDGDRYVERFRRELAP
jgi:LmbE family N-acetylglucosaminyl deacetylase